ITIPHNIHEAMEDPKWKEEILALNKNGTWNMGVLLTDTRQDLSQGYIQTYRINYQETVALNEDLEEEVVYIETPPRLSNKINDTKCLKQSPKLGLTSSRALTKDVVILKGDNRKEIKTLKTLLGNELEIEDLGNLKYFLGMDMACSSNRISNPICFTCIDKRCGYIQG
ncbi:hypothetical protein CR513_40435, partial [Mucuna pruriens]